MAITEDLINARIIIVKAADEATTVAKIMQCGSDKHLAAVVSAIHLYNKAGVWVTR